MTETQTTALLSLSQYTDEELLYELISRRRTFDVPYTRRYVCPHKEITVGIGEDHSATITLDAEALAKMKQRFSKQYAPY